MRIQEYSTVNNNKQLFNEVEHDIENYQGQGLHYPPKPKAEVDNTNRGLDNCRHHAKTEFNVLLCIQNQKTKNYTNGTHENFMPSSFLQHFFNILSMQQCF